MDLLDYHRGRLTARRLRVLVQALPRESTVARQVHGEAADWSVAEHLLAAAVDHLANANWMFAAAHTPPRRRAPDPPDPVPRPGSDGGPGDADDRRGRTRAASTEEIAAFFGRLNIGG